MMFRSVKASALFLILLVIQISEKAHALVVLQYHHIDAETPSVTSTSPDDFIKHLKLIESLDMNVLDLEIAVRKVLRGEPLPDRALAITFDDAYKSVYDVAYPLLRKRHWPFTVFVNTDAMDQNTAFSMSWQQLNTMAHDPLVNIRAGNHTVTHASLPDKPDGLTMNEWLDQEVTQAGDILKKKNRMRPLMLAYPYGEFTPAMFPWLQNRNMIAFGQQSGAIGPLSHPQALPRFPAAGIYADPETLKIKLLSLPLPVPVSQLVSPLISEKNNPPELILEIPEKDFEAFRIQCFASGQGAIPTDVSVGKGVVRIKAKAENPLPEGRSRYNCTAPSSAQKRFYWYSQPWQVLPDSENGNIRN